MASGVWLGLGVAVRVASAVTVTDAVGVSVALGEGVAVAVWVAVGLGVASTRSRFTSPDRSAADTRWSALLSAPADREGWVAQTFRHEDLRAWRAQGCSIRQSLRRPELYGPLTGT